MARDTGAVEAEVPAGEGSGPSKLDLTRGVQLIPRTTGPRAKVGPGVLQGIEQAARMLEVVARHPTGVRLTDLALELSMHKATAYRTAASWRVLGYLSQLDGGAYVLGSRLFEVAMSFAANVDYRAVAHSFLVDLNQISAETVHFSVVDTGEVLYLDKVEGRQPIQVYTSVGRRAPLHATASGKAILAHLPQPLSSSSEAVALERFTDLTITDAETLQAELDEVRRVGYAVNKGEWHLEVAGVGAPVFRVDGVCIGALSITFPAIYLTNERVAALASLLIPAATALSARLGYVAHGGGAAERSAPVDGH